jgi:hypothetical protein
MVKFNLNFTIDKYINNAIYLLLDNWAINSAVECLPYKQKVTGSNPVLPIAIKMKAF